MAFAWPANFVAMLYHASYNKDVVSRGLLRRGILVGWTSFGPESDSVVNDPPQTCCASHWIDRGVDEASRITPAFWARLRRQQPSEANIDDTHAGYGSIWPR
jgi:hypothetical protein